MIFMTTMLTGLTAALLRSAFALIIVAALVVALFLVASLVYGTGYMALVLSIAGFNAGLILFAGSAILGTRTDS